MTRSLWPSRNFRALDEVHRRKIEGSWPDLVIFPMGTRVRQGISINTRRSLMPPYAQVQLMNIECFRASRPEQPMLSAALRALGFLVNYGGHFRITLMDLINQQISTGADQRRDAFAATCL